MSVNVVMYKKEKPSGLSFAVSMKKVIQNGSL